ncbi:bifunctional phosphoglucose/phosphomannose isomerase [Thermogladius sp. 4427co]|uniref:bifunctional phosphoglucose/phosphomannose isomerase n=1 Tax=Thermogladius sp. 4427co TaxID=3450718 RepID=UPI003F795E4B
MLETYLKWPDQVSAALEEWGRVSVGGVFENIVIAGMGGSGIVGDIVKMLALEKSSIPVEVVKSHIIPGYISPRTLFISVSYSGNTHETLEATLKALRKGARIVAVTSGGRLAELAREKGIPLVGVPKGLLPRASLPSMLVGVLGVLDSSGVPVASRAEVEETASSLRSRIGDLDKAAESLAGFLLGGDLIIVATHTPFEALAHRAKSEFNENAKVIVKTDVAPEWMHNDIVGYEKPQFHGYKVVAFYDVDNPVGRELVEFMVGEYERGGRPVRILEVRGVNALDKVLSTSLLFGLASVRLAYARGLDPSATESIARYKSVAGRIFETA